MRSFRIGVTLPPQLAPARIPAMARQIEDAGFDEVWLTEDCFFAGGVAAASAALAATDRVVVVLGILPAAARNAAFAAMEIAAMAELYPERVVVGLGHGMPDWMRQVGAAPRSPLTALRERLEAVRALLHGRTVTLDGEYVRLDAVKLDHPPSAVPPLLAGVRGPRSLELAGRSADGAVLAWPVTPAYVRHAAALMSRGRILVASPISVAPDRATAAERLRPAVAAELSAPSSRAHLEPVGLAEEVERLRGVCGSVEEFADRLPREWIEKLTICGTVSDCAGAMRALNEAGAESIALSVTGAFEEQIARLGGELLPEL